MIKAIIWDIGGVLFLAKDELKRKQRNLHTSIEELWVLLTGIKKENTLQQFKSIYFKSSRGLVSKEETLTELSKLFNFSSNKIKKIILETLDKNTLENNELLNFILELKDKNYKQGILSTQWTLSNEFLITKNYNLIFDYQVISCVDGVTKPDLESFNLILDKMNISPEQTIFVDDNKKNIEVANNLGINAIFFEDNKKLREKFIELGVKIK